MSQTSVEENDEPTISPRLRLERLELLGSGHRPYFTCVVLVVQFFMVIWMCWTTGFSTVGLSPVVHQKIEPHTFHGNVVVTYTERPNPLIGPSKVQLISLGALFPPCVREDHALNLQLSQAFYPGLEKGGGRLGCCEAPLPNVAGTTTKEECDALTDSYTKWKDTRCGQRSSRESTVRHVLRPCCEELNGRCILASPQHCWFIKGRFHLNAEHCIQVDCLRQLCTLGQKLEADDYLTEFAPRRANQWWRFLTALYVPQGILDSLVIFSLQLWLSWGQENSLGSLRMALVHHTAGVGGHLIGALFAKYDLPQASAIPAVGGVLGLALVEHVVVWPALRNPKRRLIKLTGCTFLLIAVGTLPPVNNISLITGLLYGCILSLVFLSHLILKNLILAFKLILVTILVLCFFVSLVAFYGVQQVNFHPFINHLNCISYVQDLCG